MTKYNDNNTDRHTEGGGCNFCSFLSTNNVVDLRRNGSQFLYTEWGKKNNVIVEVRSEPHSTTTEQFRYTHTDVMMHGRVIIGMAAHQGRVMRRCGRVHHMRRRRRMRSARMMVLRDGCRCGHLVNCGRWARYGRSVTRTAHRRPAAAVVAVVASVITPQEIFAGHARLDGGDVSVAKVFTQFPDFFQLNEVNPEHSNGHDHEFVDFLIVGGRDFAFPL